MKLQTTTRNLLLATLWIAVGFFCLLQMKTTDVVQTIRFDSLPNTDDSVIRAYQQISAEPVVVTRRDHQLTIEYARPTRSPIQADIDWQSLNGRPRVPFSKWMIEFAVPVIDNVRQESLRPTT